MNIQKRFICAISALSQSKWLQLAIVTLAVAIVLVGITGCQPAHH